MHSYTLPSSSSLCPHHMLSSHYACVVNDIDLSTKLRTTIACGFHALYVCSHFGFSWCTCKWEHLVPTFHLCCHPVANVGSNPSPVESPATTLPRGNASPLAVPGMPVLASRPGLPPRVCPGICAFVPFDYQQPHRLWWSTPVVALHPALQFQTGQCSEMPFPQPNLMQTPTHSLCRQSVAWVLRTLDTLVTCPLGS